MSAEISAMAANLAGVRERMQRAASRVGRRAEDITLIGVSKVHPAERIRECVGYFTFWNFAYTAFMRLHLQVYYCHTSRAVVPFLVLPQTILACSSP